MTDSSVNTIRTNLTNYIESNDSSLNAIRISIQQITNTGSIQDPSINQLISYNTTQDSSINIIRDNFSSYVANSDASINTVLGSYYTKTTVDSSINTVLGSYALSSELNTYYLKTDTDSSINNVLLNYSQGINYQITNAGAGAYLINSNSNADITLIRGFTYVFSINAPGHPFWIQTSDGGYNSSDVYNAGITNNGTDSGNITWVVDNTSPNTLYYVCQYHSSMQGQINIIDLSFAPFTYVNDSLTSYYEKTAIDSSMNANFYNKTTSDSLFLAKSAFDSSMNTHYSTRVATDSSINSVLGSYALTASLNNYYLKTATVLTR